VYGRAAVKDQAPAFVTTGYSNWKTALESGSGFLQHAVAKVHLDAMESWVEHDSRILTEFGTTGTKSLLCQGCSRGGPVSGS